MRGPRSRFNRGVKRISASTGRRVLLAVAAAYLVPLALHLPLRYRFDVSGFLHVGSSRVLPEEPWAEGVFVHGGPGEGRGYDGQYYWMMAHDPFARTGLYLHLDDHLYRYRRVLYPLLCSLLSLGFPGSVPAVMLGVNLIAVLVLTRALSLLLARRGLSPWWALSVGLYFGLLQGVFFCLTDPLALCLVCLALAARERGRPRLTVLLLSAAVLTRETALVLVAVLFLFDGQRPLLSRKNLLYLLPPLVFLAWQAYLTLVFGRWPLFHGPPILGPPFAGLFANLALFSRGSLRGSLPFLLFDSLYKLLVACAFLFSLVCVARRRSVYGLMLLFHATLAMLFNNEMWGNPEGYGRVMSGVFLYLLLVWAEGRSKFGLLLVCWGIALSAVFYIRFLAGAFG